MLYIQVYTNTSPQIVQGFTVHMCSATCYMRATVIQHTCPDLFVILSLSQSMCVFLCACMCSKTAHWKYYNIAMCFFGICIVLLEHTSNVYYSSKR